MRNYNDVGGWLKIMVSIKKNCELCGKEGEAIKMLICGGPFSYLCRDCRKLADEVISRYLEMINELPFHMVATTILKNRRNKNG